MTIRADTPERGINGGQTALGVNRSIMELRHGRAIAIVAGDRTLVVVALEVATRAQLGKMLAAADSTVLLLTAERAQAAGLSDIGAGPVAIPIRGPGDLESLHDFAGLVSARNDFDPALRVAAWSGSKSLAAAGFRLAKAGRLVPALIAFEVTSCDDDSVVRVAVDAVAAHCDPDRPSLVRISESRVPLPGAERTTITLFRDEHTDQEHVAVVIGDPIAVRAVPVRMHSACLTGDVFGSLRCDCGEQLRTAVNRIADLECGVLLYLDQEGRGIGLANKLRAYAIQDSGLDTLDADGHLGFRPDERTYDMAAVMLQKLGIASVELMTNNPLKIAALRKHGIEVVGRLPLVGSTNTHNESYLRAKRERAGHLIGEIVG